MFGTSIGPVNLMLRADASMIGKDMDTAVKQLNIKGSLQRINPALGFAGLGMDKSLIKQFMREAPGVLGQSGMGIVGQLLGGAAGFLGPVGLALKLGGMALGAAGNAVRESNPEVMDEFDKQRSIMGADLSRRFGRSAAGGYMAGVVGDLANIMKVDTAARRMRDIGPSVYYDNPTSLWQKFAETMGRQGRFMRQTLGFARQGELAGWEGESPFDAGKASLMGLEDYTDRLTTAAWEAQGNPRTSNYANNMIGKTIMDAMMAATKQQSEDQADDDRNQRGIRGW